MLYCIAFASAFAFAFAFAFVFVLYCIVFYSIALYLYCILFYCIVLYLYSIILYCADRSKVSRHAYDCYRAMLGGGDDDHDSEMSPFDSECEVLTLILILPGFPR